MLEENKLFLHNCDNMEFMAKIPDKYFQLACVDPPFGIKADRQHTEGNGWVNRKSKGWDNEVPTKEYFNELFRVSENQIIWGANYFTEFLPPSMGWIVWDKVQRNFSMSHGELAFTSFQNKLQIFEYARGNESGFAPKLKLKNGVNIHPTQKPIALYKWLLSKYAKQGDKIFDSHLGSMSSVIAAYEMGFEIHGCELDKEYFDAGVKRVTNVLRQLKLF